MTRFPCAAFQGDGMSIAPSTVPRFQDSPASQPRVHDLDASRDELLMGSSRMISVVGALDLGAVGV